MIQGPVPAQMEFSGGTTRGSAPPRHLSRTKFEGNDILGLLWPAPAGATASGAFSQRRRIQPSPGIYLLRGQKPRPELWV